jgi:hypothetical protein
VIEQAGEQHRLRAPGARAAGGRATAAATAGRRRAR